MNTPLSLSWLRRLLVILVHEGLWIASVAIAFHLRFDGNTPEPIARQIPAALPVLLVSRTLAFYWSGLFHGLWRYAGLPELKNLLQATASASVIWVGAGAMVHAVQMP